MKIRLYVEIHDVHGTPLTTRVPVDTFMEGNGPIEFNVAMESTTNGVMNMLTFHDHPTDGKLLFSRVFDRTYTTYRGELVTVQCAKIFIPPFMLSYLIGVRDSVPTHESDDPSTGSCARCSHPITGPSVVAGGKDALVNGRGLPEWRYCSWACRLSDNAPEEAATVLALWGS